MKIAGVWVNTKVLPTREQIINSALNTEEYRFKRNALELINKEIDDSKLYRKPVKETKSRKKESSKVNRGTDHNKQSESNTSSKE